MAHHLLVGREITLSAAAETPGKFVVADEGRIVRLEGRVAEHMIGMHMRVDHIFDRAVGDGADRCVKLFANLGTSQRVDHRDGVVTNDEARIRHVAAILRRLHLVAPLMHEDARRDLRDFECLARMPGQHAQQRGGGERQRTTQESLA